MQVPMSWRLPTPEEYYKEKIFTFSHPKKLEVPVAKING